MYCILYAELRLTRGWYPLEIYADIVFAVNFFMDLFILWGAGQFAGKKFRPLRLCAAAFIMALLYVLFIVFVPYSIGVNILASLILISLGVYVAFRPAHARELAQLVGFSYIFAFALGGLGLALFGFTNAGSLLMEVGQLPQSFSLNILLASTAAAYIIIKLLRGWYTRRVLKRQALYDVEVFVNGEKHCFTALMDTGHSLLDPISNTPVIIAEFAAVKQFLPDHVKLIFYENREDDLYSITQSSLDNSFMARIRMIPFSALGTRNGMLIGFRTDRVDIRRGDHEHTSLREIIVGIYNSKLSGKGAYQGLLNPEILNNS